MPDVLRLLTYANRRAVARELTRRGYQVSGETLNRWVRNQAEMPLAMREAVLKLFGITRDNEESAPAWAEALPKKTADEIIERLKVSPEILGAAASMIAEREGELPPSAGSPHDSTSESDPGGAAPPLRGLG